MKRGLATAIAVLALMIGACSGESVAERIIESQEGVGDVEIDESDGQVRIEVEDEEGDASAVIGGGEIPDDFPIPVPGGGEVQAVFEQGEESSVQLLFDSSDFDSLKQFYMDWSQDAGDEVSNTFETSNPPSFGVTVVKGEASYTVSISQVGEDVLVTLFVGRG